MLWLLTYAHPEGNLKTIHMYVYYMQAVICLTLSTMVICKSIVWHLMQTFLENIVY